MSLSAVYGRLHASDAYGALGSSFPPTATLGSKPDPAQPLAAEPGRPVTQPDRDDADTVAHG